MTLQSDEISANPFWQYSLSAYGVADVAATCIALQDDYGLDVNLLLYAAWLAQEGRCLSLDHLRELNAQVADWRGRVVAPLRSLRRELRDLPSAHGVREDIKALELRAEAQQQAAMYGYFQRATALAVASRPLEANLIMVAQLASPANAGWAAGVQRLNVLLP